MLQLREIEIEVELSPKTIKEVTFGNFYSREIYDILIVGML